MQHHYTLSFYNVTPYTFLPSPTGQHHILLYLIIYIVVEYFIFLK